MHIKLIYLSSLSHEQFNFKEKSLKKIKLHCDSDCQFNFFPFSLD